MKSFRQLFVPLIGFLTWFPIARAKLKMSPATSVYLLVGDTLTLNCSVESGDSINVSTVVFENRHGRVFPQENYFYPAENVVQLQIRGMTSNGNGENYYCCESVKDSAPFTSVYVCVGDAPEVISNISKWSNNLDDMTIQFCFSSSYGRWKLSWTQEKSRATCNNNNNNELSWCNLSSANSGTRSCRTCNLSVYDIDFESALYICIIGTNVLTDIDRLEPTASEFEFQPLDFVKPGPVRNITYSSNSTAVEISWKNPSRLRYWRFPLRYQVELRSEWNESFEYAVNQTRKRYDDDDNEYDYDVFSLVIHDLSPYTEYNGSIRAHPIRNNGYWSETQTFNFRTLESAPSAGPDIDFTIPRDCDEAESGNCRNVTIFWKELNARERNGVIIGYNVTVSPYTNNRQRRSRAEAPMEMLSVAAAGEARSASIRLAQDMDYGVQVLACTKEGCSTPGKRYDVSSLHTDGGQESNAPWWVLGAAAVIVSFILIVYGITKARKSFTLDIQTPPKVIIGEANDYLLSGESSQGIPGGYSVLSEQGAIDQEACLPAAYSTDEQTPGSVNRDSERNEHFLPIAEESQPRSTSAEIPMTSRGTDVIGRSDDVTADGDSFDEYSKTMMTESNIWDNVPATPASRVTMATGSSTVAIEMEEQEENTNSGDYSTGVLERNRPVAMDTVVLDTGGYQATETSAGEDDELGGSTDESVAYAKAKESDSAERMESRQEDNRMESSLEEMQMESSLEEDRMLSSLEEEDRAKAHSATPAEQEDLKNLE